MDHEVGGVRFYYLGGCWGADDVRLEGSVMCVDGVKG